MTGPPWRSAPRSRCYWPWDGPTLSSGVIPPRSGGVPGTTDGTIITRDTGIPTVVYGPGGKWIAHQADEFVEVEEIPRYADTYARAAQIFLSGSAA